MRSQCGQPRTWPSACAKSSYLTAASILVELVVAWGANTYVFPALRRTPVLWSLLQVGGYGVAIALVFVFLRPISQFIYFQF